MGVSLLYIAFTTVLTFLVRKSLVKYGTMLLIISEKSTNRLSSNSVSPNQLEDSQEGQVCRNHNRGKRNYKIPKYLKVITDGTFYGEASAKDLFIAKMEKSKKIVSEKYGNLRDSSKKLSHRKAFRAAKKLSKAAPIKNKSPKKSLGSTPILREIKLAGSSKKASNSIPTFKRFSDCLNDFTINRSKGLIS